MLFQRVATATCLAIAGSLCLSGWRRSADRIRSASDTGVSVFVDDADFEFGSTSLLQVGHKVSTQDIQAERLHIISVTGEGKYESFSIKTQRLWERHLGPQDTYTNVCDTGCGDVVVDGRRLDNILRMNDSVFPLNGGECLDGNGEPCNGYQRAQMKFVWGFTSEYKRLKDSGRSMPKWWFIKDDDTYVHADRLMELVENLDPIQEQIVYGNLASHLTCIEPPDYMILGGSGWLISAAAAQPLVMDYGDEWMRFQQQKLQDPCFYYDAYVASFLMKAGVQRVENRSAEFRAADLINVNMIDEDTDCKRLVSYHMKPDLVLGNETYALAKVEKCFS